MRTVDAKTLKAWLNDGGEIALLDVREQGQYGESHLFFGVPLPFSRLELDIARLVPRRPTRIVVYDDGALGVAERAAARLEEVGYSGVHVLEGGTEAWRRAGHALFAGVNVPSKTFGELVEHELHTPRVSAAELRSLQSSGEDLILIDGRPLAEFRKMSIPGATCCPNGELAYRIHALAPDPRTRIVVNCAGRTRSIIGAQTLIDLGIPNPVHALENGTQGWYLSDFPLEHGASRGYPTVAGDDRGVAAARERARKLARRQGVRYATDEEIERRLEDPTRTTYLCDVRTPEEFAAGSIPGAVNAPGGQLLQATDQWVAVRGARIVVLDAEGVRAPVIASWLVRMGYDACVLERGTASRVRALEEPVPLPEVAPISVEALAAALGDGVAVVDVRPSMAYRKGHVPGSLWAIRPRFASLVPALEGRRVALVADEPGIARIAAHDLALAGVASLSMLAGGFAAWRDAGPPVDATPHIPPDAACIDYLFFVHDRHDGNKDAARRYLAWETQLLSQLEPEERASYRLG